MRAPFAGHFDRADMTEAEADDRGVDEDALIGRKSEICWWPSMASWAGLIACLQCSR